ncbi:MAG: hypothetical protein IKX30_00890 [Victivallales bacterium]|nr:hypothetical protein [Victivallales bacterium]
MKKGAACENGQRLLHFVAVKVFCFIDKMIEAKKEEGDKKCQVVYKKCQAVMS